MKYIHLIILAISVLCAASCGPTETEVNKIKKTEYQKGVNAGRSLGERAALTERDSLKSTLKQKSKEIKDLKLAHAAALKEAVIKSEKTSFRKGRREKFLTRSFITFKYTWPRLFGFGLSLFLVVPCLFYAWKVIRKYIPQSLEEENEALREFRKESSALLKAANRLLKNLNNIHWKIEKNQSHIVELQKHINQCEDFLTRNISDATRIQVEQRMATSQTEIKKRHKEITEGVELEKSLRQKLIDLEWKIEKMKAQGYATDFYSGLDEMRMNLSRVQNH